MHKIRVAENGIIRSYTSSNHVGYVLCIQKLTIIGLHLYSIFHGVQDRGGWDSAGLSENRAPENPMAHLPCEKIATRRVAPTFLGQTKIIIDACVTR